MRAEDSTMDASKMCEVVGMTIDDKTLLLAQLMDWGGLKRHMQVERKNKKHRWL